MFAFVQPETHSRQMLIRIDINILCSTWKRQTHRRINSSNSIDCTKLFCSNFQKPFRFVIRYFSSKWRKGSAAGTRTRLRRTTHARTNQNPFLQRIFQFEFFQLQNYDGWWKAEETRQEAKKQKLYPRPMAVSFAYAEKRNTTDVAHKHVRYSVTIALAQ